MNEENKNDFRIQLATREDLGAINALFRDVIEDINTVKKLSMWNSEYPFCEFENDINKGEMYSIEFGDKTIGSFVLNEFDDPYYADIQWTTDDKKWFTINRLVILPTEQGKGYAKRAMDFIEDYAAKNKYEAIRLTVYKDNVYAIGLYEKYGFKKIEDCHCIIEGRELWGFEKEV